MNNKKKLVELLFEKGILIQQDLMEDASLEDKFFEKIETDADLLVLNKDYLEVINHPGPLVDWYEIDQYKVEVEKNRNDELYQTQLQQFKSANHTLSLKGPALNNEKIDFSSEQDSICGLDSEELNQEYPLVDAEINPLDLINSAVTVILSFENHPKKYNVGDFTKIFRSRFKFLEKLLQHRREMQKLTTVSRLELRKEREEVALIGMVSEIGETKSGNLVLTLEDLTGRIKIFISKSKSELFLGAKDLVVDEVIGVSGILGDKIIFAEKIIWPDIPQDNPIKKAELEQYAVFLSDIHVGSTLFLKDEFNKFLSWINGEFGNDQQKEIAKKVKYLFIAGDLVDGIGIYPSQEEELEIKDIHQQYQEFVRLIKKIPNSISIIICPGNHDMVHLAEPQPVFYQKFAPGLFDLSNVQLVTNPAVVNIAKTNSFAGLNVLLYHGFSFDYYVANVESIRSGGGYHRSDLIMKFLLKRRHLAPSFKSTPYFPSHEEDPLLIRTIPDILITGHIHYCNVANYKGVTMISGSCWQAKTSFQEKLGHEPEPARVPVVNLKTREIKILRFG